MNVTRVSLLVVATLTVAASFAVIAFGERATAGPRDVGARNA